MGVNLGLVNNIGSGNESIYVIVCIRSDACIIAGASSSDGDEVIVYLDKEINLVTVWTLGVL